ncbi:hypothetical protein SOVF_130430 [Spinacia oleracea]|nr:hypothetical protein SOVF_130430 [Spinacia oleracea]
MGVNSEIAGQQDALPADVTSVKTFTRKKVAKKLSETDDDVKELDKESGVKSDKNSNSTEHKPEVKSDATGVNVVRDGPVKRLVKRKIIKRVPKKKGTGGVVANSENKTVIQSQDGNMNTSGKLSDNVGDDKVDEDKANVGGNLVKCAPTTTPGVEGSQKHDDTVLSSKVEKSTDKVKGKEKVILDENRVSDIKNALVKDIQADSKGTSKGKAKEKERKKKDKKYEPRSKSSKDTE